MKIESQKQRRIMITSLMFFFLEVYCVPAVIGNKLGLPIPSYVSIFTTGKLFRILSIAYLIFGLFLCYSTKAGLKETTKIFLIANGGLGIVHLVEKFLPKGIRILHIGLAFVSVLLMLFLSMNKSTRYIYFAASCAYPTVYLLICILGIGHFAYCILFYLVAYFGLIMFQNFNERYSEAFGKSVWAGLLAMYLLEAFPIIFHPFSSFHERHLIGALLILLYTAVWLIVIASCFVVNIMFEKVKKIVQEKTNIGDGGVPTPV